VKSWRPLWRFAALAALVHVQVVALMVLLAYRFAPRAVDLIAEQDTEPAAMIAIDDERVRQMLAEAEPEDRSEPTKPSGQVVTIPKPDRDERPEDAKFVAEYDSKVARETRRRGDGSEAYGSNADPGAPSETRSSAREQPSRPQRARGLLALRPGWPEPPRAPDPEVAVPPEGATWSEQQSEIAPAAGAPSRPERRRLSLALTSQQMDRALGGGTSDHLPDIDEGDETALNARSWRYATFFNRVKSQIRSHWHAGREYQKRDPTGQVYGQGVRSTLLRLHLHADGRLAEVALEKGAGLDFLDDAAVAAVRDAQPYSNPPPELVDSSGFIRFRFGFFFEVSGAPRVKVYRYSGL
jgi:TonB family protein